MEGSSADQADTGGIRGWAEFLGSYLLITCLLLAGALLRVLAWLTYKPAILGVGDSLGYLRSALGEINLAAWHPQAYPLVLKPLLAFDTLAVVTAAQHLLGLSMGVGIFVLLRHLGVGGTVAALGAAPVLLDGYQINLEQQILSETLFEALLVGAVMIVAWRERPGLSNAFAGGVLVGAAVVVRFAGLVALIAIPIYLLVKRAGWLRVGVALVGLALPMLAYASWMRAETGDFALSSHSGFVLYGRVATFAECERVDLPRNLRRLCIGEPVDERQDSYSIWIRNSPLRSYMKPHGIDEDAEVTTFSRRIIMEQPADFFRSTGEEFLTFFAPASPSVKEPIRSARWRFPRKMDELRGIPNQVREANGSPPEALGLNDHFAIDGRWAPFLRSYQDLVYSYGPLLALGGGLGLIGAILGRVIQEARDPRPESFLLALTGLALYITPALAGGYHVRYFVPGVPFLGAAGVLGAWLIVHRIRATRHDPA
jgi:hypothetical protein